ncbi:OmpA family protein [Frigidibacter albus]|uniref:OmpA family protein n=1 Tax=Frigidibacter albus TaxID=1465486 RepID=A0A6L8VJN8_9RHOB|nr:OmpA family protein [Frigidibacter albus]MZQ90565.1 OmpA family protein [Frigidibacter albus]NBE32779.1 OmpA family protein [Frigidibacter albus]GGH60867.1 hypothetical protein GCM10011341_33530 [Frigidibacter albus]
MRSKMKTTRAARATALMASLSMALPVPVYAQSDATVLCADGTVGPCAEGNNPNEEPRSEDEAEDAAPDVQPEPAPEEVPAEPTPDVTPEPAPEQQPVPDETPAPAPEELPQPDTAPEIPAGETEGSLGDALNRVLEGEEAVDEAPVEEPAAEEAPVEEAPVEEAPVEAPAEEPAVEDAPAVEEPAVEEPAVEEPAAEAESGEDALRRALEAETGEAPAEEAAPEAEVEAETETEIEAAPEADAVPDADADAAPEADAAETTEEPAAEEGGLGAALGALLNGDDAEEQPADEAEAEAEVEAEADTAATGVAPVVEDGQPTEQMLVDQPDAASGEPTAAAALQALIGDDGAAEASDDVAVVEETVTEESARSSSEDFENTVSERREERRRDNDDDDDDDDDDRWNSALSDREKVMLLGIGALAVGAVISNNRRVELNSGDRVVVQRPDGQYEVIKDDDVLLRQPGSNVRTEQFNDGSSRTTVLREDGSRIVTIYSPEMRVLRRTRIDPNGREYLLIDDTVTYEPVNVATLPPPRQNFVELSNDEAALRTALAQQSDFGRRFSLSQVRNIAEVRSLVPVIDVNAITFATGSAAITADQAQSLASVGRLIQGYIDENPQEVFLIEGHTDAVGSAASNLALSDRRAESVALALTEYFDVPPENMVVQGYGESYLRVNTEAAEQANRRASVRRITDLLQTASN